MKYSLLVLSLLFSKVGFAAESCEVIGKVAAVIYVYCPAKMSIDEIGKVAKSYSEIHFNKAMNQIHIHIFNNKKNTPKDTNVFMKMSDAAVDKYQVAIAAVNKNTKHISFQCYNKGKLKDCIDKFK